MKLEVNISKNNLIVLIGLFVIAIGILAVNALAPNPGHIGTEIELVDGNTLEAHIAGIYGQIANLANNGTPLYYNSGTSTATVACSSSKSCGSVPGWVGSLPVCSPVPIEGVSKVNYPECRTGPNAWDCCHGGGTATRYPASSLLGKLVP